MSEDTVLAKLDEIIREMGVEKDTVRLPKWLAYAVFGVVLSLATGQALDVTAFLPWAAGRPVNCEVPVTP